MYGWVYLTVIASGAMAAISIVSASYLAFLLPLNQTGIKVAAVAIILIATLVNVVRVKAGEILVNVLTGLKLIGIAGVIVIGIWMGKADLSFTSVNIPESIGSPISAFGLALIGVLYSFAGWQYASFVAGEARDARQTVPRAMILGAVVVSVVYLMTNLAYMLLLPVNQIASSDSLAADALSTVLPFGGIAVAAAIFVSTFGTVGVFALSTPRIYFAMSEDGLFFRSLSKVHPRFRTPVNAILIQSGWAVGLLLLWGTFENLITYVVFTDWVFFGLTAVAVFVFRKKRKDIERPYRVWGYPVTPLIFITITFAFVLVTLLEKPFHALAGLFLVGVSQPFFLYFKSSQKKRLISTAAKE
jgi:APA family basic amino acid/polyamine antiporter